MKVRFFYDLNHTFTFVFLEVHGGPPVIRWNSMEMLSPDAQDENITPPASPLQGSKTALLIMVLHAGTALDSLTQHGKVRHKSSVFICNSRVQ